ncbi:MAG: hypothetical protein BZY88_05490 [SAR202 cluster bacterium Io17-Chloro-G9]|nr:MAG: hypothetical protein BZY88_05490 [SAR202 cluster bacterium Io17-Chloro-G9]
MIRWQYYPKSNEIPGHLSDVLNVFQAKYGEIGSPQALLHSDRVLAILRSGFESLGFEVESGKKANEKIMVPVLFGQNGQLEKSFEADAVNHHTGTVIEVEAGRGYTNYQFLKDLFEACMMHNIEYLVIAVRNVYRKSPDFEKIIDFFDSLYASARLRLPFQGLLVVGY